MNEFNVEPSVSFRRSGSDRVIGGVAGALGPRVGLSALGLRLAFAGLGLLGIGVPLYLAVVIGTRTERDDRPVPPIRSIVAALIAVVGLLAPWWLAANDVPPYRDGDLPLVFLGTMIGAGALFLFGRRALAPAAPRTRSDRPIAPWFRLPHPPTLLLVTLSTAAVVGLAVWLVVRSREGTENYGATLAAALVVVGLGVVVSAWRGRSFLLAPLGLALAVPLALSAFADVRFVLGTDDPGTITGATPAEQTFDLGRGAGPVTVSRSAVDGGLRTLTIRKPAGTIDVQLDPATPVEITLRSVSGSGFVVDDAGHREYGAVGFPDVTRISLPAVTAGPTETLKLELESVVGNIFVVRSSGTPAKPGTQPRADGLTTALAEARADLASRQTYLATEKRALAKLEQRYGAVVTKLDNAPLSPVAAPVPPAVLGVPEATWPTTRVDDPRLRELDPALDWLVRAGRLASDGRDLRYEILRASWRVTVIERGITAVEKRITRLEQKEPTR